MSCFKITGGKGFHITFDNGWTVSVQFGPGNYCDNYDGDMIAWSFGPKESIESTTAEIAAWDKDHTWFKFDGDTVLGRQTVEQVWEFMEKIRRMEPNEGPDGAAIGGTFRQEDAHLIAAAPDLLEALKQIQNLRVKPKKNRVVAIMDADEETINRMREIAAVAIAKAEGRDP